MQKKKAKKICAIKIKIDGKKAQLISCNVLLSEWLVII